MNVAFLHHMTVLAQADSSGGGGFFSEAARRFSAGGGGMWPILGCALIAIAIIADRITYLYFRASASKEGLLRGLKKHLYAGDLDKAINYVAGQRSTPLANVVKAGLMNVPKGEEEVQAALDEATLRETPKLEARTGYLAMLGNAAMLAGLLGTVNGLIGCFAAVATVNPADKATILSRGISEAMNCTFFGLLTAIPALVFFSILNGRTQALINDINETSVSVLNLVVSNREKFKNATVRGGGGDEE